MASVKISEITLPEHYVRGQIKSKHVQDLLDVVATHNGVAAWSDLVGKKTVQWPFPEIEIGKNLTPKPDKIKKEKGDKTKAPKLKKWFPFELIDGAHRLTVAKRLKMKEIDAITRGIDNAGARYLHQYKTNVGHGLRLDKDARDNAIRTLAKVFSISQKELVKETGLDVSSVSRIINSRQRKEGPRSAPSKPRANVTYTATDAEAISTASPAPSGSMTVEGFIDRLQGITREFPKLQAAVLAFLVANTPKSKLPKLGEFAGLVRAIADTFDDATKPESQPAPATPPVIVHPVSQIKFPPTQPATTVETPDKTGDQPKVS